MSKKSNVIVITYEEFNKHMHLLSDVRQNAFEELSLHTLALVDYDLMKTAYLVRDLNLIQKLIKDYDPNIQSCAFLKIDELGMVIDFRGVLREKCRELDDVRNVLCDCIARYNQYIDIINDITQNKIINYHMVDNNGMNPLMYASKIGNLKAVKSIVASGVMISIDHSGVFLKVPQDNSKLIKSFVNLSDHINMEPKDAFLLAALGGYTDIIKYFVSKGVNVHGGGWYKSGIAGLTFAVLKGHLDLVRYFIKECNIDPNITLPNGLTLLMIATENDSLEVVKYLVEAGADLKKKGENNVTTLMYAARVKAYGIIKYILENDREHINDQADNGATALMVSVFYNNYGTMVHLCKNGADSSIKANNGDSVLTLVTQHGEVEALAFLIESGANINEIHQVSGGTLLHYAAQYGKLNIVKYLIENNAVNYVENKDGLTPLMVACQNGYVSIVEYLAKSRKVDIDQTSVSTGMTALMVAAENGQKDVVESLILYRADTKKQNYNKETALILARKNCYKDVVNALLKANEAEYTDISNLSELMLASYKGDLKLVEHLVSQNININQYNHKWYTPLMFAAQKGHVEVVKFLVGNGANVEKYNRDDGSTAFIIAAAHGQLEVVQYLHQSKAQDVANKNGRTALMVAVQGKHFNVVKYLVEVVKSNVNHDINGMTILMFAHSVEIAKCLVEYGARVNDKNRAGETALMFVSKKGCADVVEYLLELGANVNEKNNMGDTVLINAVQGGYLGVVELLVKYGALIDEQNNNGSTAFMFSMQKGCEKIMYYLASMHADINHCDNNGDTALIIAAQNGLLTAVQYIFKLNEARKSDALKWQAEVALAFSAQNGYFEMVNFFVENKVNINQSNNKINATPFMLAAQNGHLKIVELLLKHDAEIDWQDESGMTPLIAAVQNGYLDVVEYLVEHKANVNKQESIHGKTAIMFAAYNGYMDIVKYLLENGANVNIKSNSGTTASDFASENKHQDIANILQDIAALHTDIGENKIDDVGVQLDVVGVVGDQV